MVLADAAAARAGLDAVDGSKVATSLAPTFPAPAVRHVLALHGERAGPWGAEEGEQRRNEIWRLDERKVKRFCATRVIRQA